MPLAAAQRTTVSCRAFRTNSFQKKVIGAEYLILDCLKKVIEDTLHLFRDIGLVVLGLKNLVRFRRNQRLPFRLGECQAHIKFVPPGSPFRTLESLRGGSNLIPACAITFVLSFRTMALISKPLELSTDLAILSRSDE